MKRAAEKAKKEANNRARKSSHDTNKVDKAIAAQVRLDFHLFFRSNILQKYALSYLSCICPQNITNFMPATL
jgi:hypothetical protein